MIELVGVAGSPVKEGNTEVLLDEAFRVTAEDLALQRKIFTLSGRQIDGCRHCNWCVKNQTPEKFCVISDGMDEIYPALLRADVIILATPVHIARMSGLMANMLDRMRVFVHGNLYRGKLKDKVGGALVAAYRRHGGLESTLIAFNTTFALFHMIPVGEGGLVLTSLGGQGRVIKGRRHMVLEDEFGLASAKEVVRRAVEIARIVQAGKKALQMG